ncbi:DNA replication complex GINS protein psf-3 [Thozetella sp. PMI_491]|nr:DNA replication complex GINS protein psf-3 [Thozetella sp. PMI_491]
MSYYDIDAILTDAEKVPCTFEIEVPELGYLDNNPTHALKAGTQLALPLWLSEMLAIANTAGAGEEAKSFVTLSLPNAISNDVIQALKADPRAVPLRDQSAHFYSLGTHMLDLFEEKELATVLRKTYVTRAADVALHARKVGGTAGGSKGGKSGQEGSNLGIGGGGEEFLRGLDEWERKLFRKAHDGTKAGKDWMETVKR